MDFEVVVNRVDLAGSGFQPGRLEVITGCFHLCYVGRLSSRSGGTKLNKDTKTWEKPEIQQVPTAGTSSKVREVSKGTGLYASE